jgi:hypothetical protein
MESKQIEKPWAVYGFGRDMIGKVVEICGLKKDIAKIAYSDTDSFPDLWELTFTNLFSTSREALEFYYNRHPVSVSCSEKILEIFSSRFKGEQANLEGFIPWERREGLQQLVNTLSTYHKQRSQSSPLYAEPGIRRIDAMEPGYSEADD